MFNSSIVRSHIQIQIPQNTNQHNIKRMNITIQKHQELKILLPTNKKMLNTNHPTKWHTVSFQSLIFSITNMLMRFLSLSLSCSLACLWIINLSISAKYWSFVFIIQFSGSYDMVKNEVELLAGRDFKKDEQVLSVVAWRHLTPNKIIIWQLESCCHKCL